MNPMTDKPEIPAPCKHEWLWSSSANKEVCGKCAATLWSALHAAERDRDAARERVVELEAALDKVYEGYKREESKCAALEARLESAPLRACYDEEGRYFATGRIVVEEPAP